MPTMRIKAKLQIAKRHNNEWTSIRMFKSEAKGVRITKTK